MSARKTSTRGKQRNRRKALSFETLESRQLLAVTTLSPVADTWITSGGSPGSDSVLDVRDFTRGDDRIAYIRFDLSGIDIQDLNSATLTLHKQPASRNDSMNTGRFVVQGLTSVAGNTAQDWNESTLSSSTVGAEYTNVGGEGIDLSRVFNLDLQQMADVLEGTDNITGFARLTGDDLVTFLESRIADDGLVTFITYVEETVDRGWGYGSRENTDPSLRPTLELNFAGEEIPDPYPENPVRFTRQVEYLNRGIVAIRESSQIYVGWRMLGTDPADIAFNLYRSTGGGASMKLNGSPLTTTTDFVDTTANLTQSNEYFVRAVVGGVEQDPSESFTVPAFAPAQQYLSFPLSIPTGGNVPDYQNPGEFLPFTYNANDASVGDLDGDGDYEIVLKWDPSNSQDVSIPGYTGTTIFDAYTLEGQLLWRIDLGINIRSGAHYTPFIVYDLDGDGKAEVAMKTAPGTIDGEGHDVILPGDDPDADYRNSDGRITTGPEYLTIFNGETGAAMVTIPYEPARNDVTTWGDDWGNRSERHLAGVAYLDGVRPSLIFTRGYNGPASGFSMARTDVVAYNWRDGELTELWHFKARFGQENNINVQYIAQGNHNLSIADVDGDGFDEIIYGAAVIDHDGTGLYSTGLGHGDAIHVSDMDPTNPGLEVFQPHESPGSYLNAGGEFRDAMTGQLIFGIPANNDVGRGVAADIDPNNPGYEMWATTNPGGASRLVYSASGQGLYRTDAGTTNTSSDDIPFNFLVWWDANPLRELLDGTTISRWRYDLPTPQRQTVLSLSGTSSNNGSKSTPSLTADLFGDWREEVMMRSSNNQELRIYTTTIPSTMRLFSLMHDTQYREAIAWQNAGYNQPPHPSFFLGAGMTMLPQPDVYVATGVPPIPGDFDFDHDVDRADLVIWEQTYGTSPTGAYFGDADNDGDADGDDFLIWQQNLGMTSMQLTAAQTFAPESAPVVAARSVESSLVARDEALASLAMDGLPGAVNPETSNVPVGGSAFTSAAEDAPRRGEAPRFWTLQHRPRELQSPRSSIQSEGNKPSANEADTHRVRNIWAPWDLLASYRL